MKEKKLNFVQINELINVIKNSKSSNKEVRRAQAILMLNDSSSIEQVKILTNYSKRHAFALKSNYASKGLVSILDKPKKVISLLTRSQRIEILDILNNKSPKNFNYDSDFWSTNILADLIKKNYGVTYKSKKPFYLLFKEAKYSFKKPEKVYERRNQAEINEWIKINYDRLEKAFNDPDVAVLTEDEMILSTQTTTQYVWLRKGSEPAKIQIATKRKNKSIYGFLNIKTGAEHAFVAEYQNMFITVDILKKVILIYPNKKLLILWDGAGWHRGSEVSKFIDENKSFIETILFPAATPELNPQEHIWKAGRSNITHNKFIPDIGEAASQFVKFLNSQKFAYSLLNFSAKIE